MKGFGDISVGLKGERYSGKIQVCFGDSGRFSCKCFDPFGSTIVALHSYKDSATIALGDSDYRISCSDHIDKVPYFRRFPFTFSAIARILSGQLPKNINQRMKHHPDTVWESRIYRYEHWENEKIDVTAKVAKRNNVVKNISLSRSNGKKWKMSMEEFDKSIAKQIRFETDGKNYFRIMFSKIEAGKLSCQPGVIR